MLQRCNNPRHPRYANWGGRGITVFEQWKTFRNFLVDMGIRPDGMTLDRIDVNGNYEPGNCKWSTPKEQTQNRRPLAFAFEKLARATLERMEASGYGPPTLPPLGDDSTRGYWTVDEAAYACLSKETATQVGSKLGRSAQAVNTLRHRIRRFRQASADAA